MQMKLGVFVQDISLSGCLTASPGLTADPCANSSNGIAGSPTNLSAVSAATISASGVEWLTHVCRLETAAIGTCVYFPIIAKYTPDVDLAENGHPAKSASANS
eukprot:3641715-Amphidinium_carterae.1